MKQDEKGQATTAVTPDPIFQVASGFMAAKHLFVANEVGLFEQLADGPATLDELSGSTGVARRRLRILADAMVVLGFVERHGDLYQNAPIAATFLTGRTPADLRPFLRFWNRVSYPAWTNLEKAIRTGQAQATVTWPEETQRIVSEGVAAIQAAPSQALPSTYDFGRHRRILDLGGGTGSWLRAILRQYSNLEGTLFELPPTATVARQHLASDPATRQVKVVEGDLFKDPIPAGHDVVLIANVMHLLSAERNLVLLRLTRQCVPDGGRLLLADYWTDATHTQPAFAALMAGEFLVGTGEGDVYSEEEARRWLQETGWQALERKPLAVPPVSVIIAETAQ
ncbi:MAG TPA: methyltransferase [Chthoniobacterales bacterium]|nr:methyltransferase [Chthoniobacterales bacterium]